MFQIELNNNQNIILPYFFRRSIFISYAIKHNYIFTLDKKKQIVIWDKQTLLPLKMIKTSSEVNHISICNNAPLILITGLSDKVWVHNFMTNKNRFIKIPNKIRCSTFTSVKQHFLIGGNGIYIFLINAENGEYICKFKKPFNSETLVICSIPYAKCFFSVEGFIKNNSNGYDSMEIVYFDFYSTNVVKRKSYIKSDLKEVAKIKDDNFIIEHPDNIESNNFKVGNLHGKDFNKNHYSNCFIMLDDIDKSKIFSDLSNFQQMLSLGEKKIAKKSYRVHKELGIIAEFLTSFNEPFYSKLKPVDFKKNRTKKIHFTYYIDYIIISSFEKDVQILNLATLNIDNIINDFATFTDIKFSEDSSLLIYLDDSFKKLNIIDYRCKTLINSYKHSLIEETIVSFHFVKKSNRILIETSNHVSIFDFKIGKVLYRVKLPFIDNVLTGIKAHFLSIDSTYFIYVNHSFVGLFDISGKQHYLNQLDFETHNELNDCSIQALCITSLKKSACGKFVICGTYQGFIVLINIFSGIELLRKQVSDSEISEIFVYPEGDKILALCRNDDILVLEYNSLRQINQLSNCFSGIKSITSINDKKYLIVQQEEYNKSLSTGFHINTFIDYNSLEKHATLLYNGINDYGFFLADGRYEVTQEFMSENYLTKDLEIINNKEEFIKNSTVGLLFKFLKGSFII
jgi:hypothetical protein